MKKTSNFILLMLIIVIGAMPVTGHDYSYVGSPAFKAISNASGTMTLKYGFLGTSIYDSSLRRWTFHKMRTITRSKVEGYVNQINNNFALAAGLYDISVYDYSKHKWFTYKSSVNDYTRDLATNCEVTLEYVKVRVLNGPFIKYTSKYGWAKL